MKALTTGVIQHPDHDDLSMHILFLAMHHPGRSPSQRFRFEQLLPALEAAGHTWEVSGLLSESEADVFYGGDQVLQKIWLGARGAWRRLSESRPTALDRFDLVYVHREAFFLGGPWLERRFAAASPKVVLDFDDAIWLPAVSEGNRRWSWLKRPEKLRTTVGLVDLVVAGNRYLSDFAHDHGARRVEIVPTTVDTDHYMPEEEARAEHSALVVGWSGSPTTVPHFELVLPALRRLRASLGERVEFLVIGDARYEDPELGIRGTKWTAESELELLRRIDIGLMPLPDEPWARGKCGLKGLLYMALAIPALLSPVGVNRELVEEGLSGFLPLTEDDWVLTLTQLAESSERRRAVGQAARQRVIERYSTAVHAPRWVGLLEELVA